MRTALLFNDTILDIRHHIYIKWKGGREQDSGETERESVCERQSIVDRGGSVGCKMDHWRNL